MVPNKLSIDDLLDNLRVFGQGGGIEAETDRQAAEVIVSQQAEIRDLAMEVLAATGQAQEACTELKAAEKTITNTARLRLDLEIERDRLKGILADAKVPDKYCTPDYLDWYNRAQRALRWP